MTSERTAGRYPAVAAVPAARTLPPLGVSRAATPLPPPPGPQGGHATGVRSLPGRTPVVPELPGGAVSGGSAAPPGVQDGQTWVLEFPAGMELLTSNNRLSRYAKARIVKALRAQGWVTARHNHLPLIRRADIHVTYLPPPRRREDRHPFASARVEDGDALAPTGKSLIDGIADAGIFGGADTRKRVRRVTYELLPGSCPRGQLAMHITEVAS